jgi:ABC-type multidrug transport system ATPase subunit
MILDEATSNVDTRTEILIQKAVARLRPGRTSFVIALRLSTVRDADTIGVMAAGRIVEQGRHEELLSRGGSTVISATVSSPGHSLRDQGSVNGPAAVPGREAVAPSVDTSSGQ